MRKLMLGLGVGIIICGVAMLIKGHTLIGGCLMAGGVLWDLLTLIIGRAMDKHVQESFDQGTGDQSLEMRVNQAISSSRQNKFKAESEIRRLNAWCNDAIFNTYHAEYEKVGSSYNKESLLENFNEIKDKFSGAVSFETADKCERIVNDYKLKIDGYKERIKVFEEKEQEYTELKAKLKAIKQQEKINQKLSGHQKKLESASMTEAISMVEAEDNSVQQLSIGDVAREVAEKEEYFRQLEQLEFKYK
ncbi:MAG: hypothetical protein MJZ61_09530 [Bacteroidales bacterium]|nr:hypothetical protein [Bacteroidales bacterium]